MALPALLGYIGTGAMAIARGIDVEITDNNIVGVNNGKIQEIDTNLGTIIDDLDVTINNTQSPLTEDFLKGQKQVIKALREIAKATHDIGPAIRGVTSVIAEAHNFNMQKHGAEALFLYDLKTAINGETQDPATDNLFKAQKAIGDKLENIGDSSDIVEELKNLINLEQLTKLDKLESYKTEFANLSNLTNLTNIKNYSTQLNNLSKLSKLVNLDNIKSYKDELGFLQSIKKALIGESTDYSSNNLKKAIDSIDVDITPIKNALIGETTDYTNNNIKLSIDDKEISLETGDINADLSDTNEALNSIASKLNLFSNINSKTNAVNNLVGFWSETKEFFNFMNKKPSADKESPRQLMTNYWLENSITFQKINSITVNSSTLSGFTYDRANTQSSIFSKVKSIFNFKI